MRTARCTPTASRRPTRRVPFVNQDEAQMEPTEKFLKSGFISVDIFAVSPIDETTEGRRWCGAPRGQHAAGHVPASPSARRRSSRGRS